jgi:two-component system response regulator NreC
MTVRILVADHVDIAGAARGHDDLDVVVVDLDGAESPAGALQLYCESVDAAVVALGSSDDPELVREVLAAGASAYLVKEDGHSHLLAAVRRAADGDRYLHPTLELRLEADGHSEPLSDRELDVLRLVVEGYTNREIASELELSLRSIELLRARLREKLGVTSRGELVRYALGRGLVR